MSTERKVAVVTGASQGSGADLVRGFLDKGYLVDTPARGAPAELDEPDPAPSLGARPRPGRRAAPWRTRNVQRDPVRFYERIGSARE